MSAGDGREKEYCYCGGHPLQYQISLLYTPGLFIFLLAFKHTALHLYQIPHFNFNLLFALQKVVKPTVALCQQKCKRSGTLESSYCSSNFGKEAKFVSF